MSDTQLAAPAKAPTTVREMLGNADFQAQLTLALPKHLKVDKFVRVILTAMNTTPALATCTMASVAQCVLDAAQMGLLINKREAHLIPFKDKDKGTVVCTLIPDFKGLCKLAIQSGSVSNIHADKVCEHDEFEYDRGIVAKHKIDFKKDRGEAYAYYCIVRMKDGGEKAEAMNKEDVDKIRARSKAAKSGPWVSDYDEMAKKTVLRRALKTIPMSPDLHLALDRDDETFTEREEKTVAAFVMPQAEDEAPPVDETEKPPAVEAVLDRMPELKELIKKKKVNETKLLQQMGSVAFSIEELSPEEIEVAIGVLQ